jgi:hypothetical protein
LGFDIFFPNDGSLEHILIRVPQPFLTHTYSQGRDEWFSELRSSCRIRQDPPT